LAKQKKFVQRFETKVQSTIIPVLVLIQ